MGGILPVVLRTAPIRRPPVRKVDVGGLAPPVLLPSIEQDIDRPIVSELSSNHPEQIQARPRDDEEESRPHSVVLFGAGVDGLRRHVEHPPRLGRGRGAGPVGEHHWRARVALERGAVNASLKSRGTRHDPDFRCVRREHLIETGQQVRLKKDIKRFVEWLDTGADEFHFSFYVISAAPRAAVQSALEGIVAALCLPRAGLAGGDKARTDWVTLRESPPLAS